MRVMLTIARRDLRRMWKYKWWLTGLIAMNLSDLFIMALIFNNVVRREYIPDYVKFVAPGITVIALFASSFSIGREVAMEIRKEINLYLLSLPVKTYELLVGRLLGGVIRGFIYVAPFIVLLNLVNGLPNVEYVAYAALGLLGVAFAISSLSISLSALARRIELQATVRSVLYFVLFFFSTVFYPRRIVRVMPESLQNIVHYNPISIATELLRAAYNAAVEPPTLYSIAELYLTATLLTVVGMRVYLYVLRKR